MFDQASSSYSLSKMSIGFPSSIYLDLSFNFNWSKVFETTPILISIDLISFLTLVMDFLMFYNGLLSLNDLPVSSILDWIFVSFSLTSINSVSSSCTFLEVFQKLLWMSFKLSEWALQSPVMPWKLLVSTCSFLPIFSRALETSSDNLSNLLLTSGRLSFTDP